MSDKICALTLCFLLAGLSAAFAEDRASPETVKPEGTTQVKPDPVVPEKTVAKEKSAIESVKDKAEQKPKVSERDIARYKAHIAGLIAGQARRYGSIGSGTAVATFRVNSFGKIDSIVVKSSSSPKHADLARRILNGVNGGTPPVSSISLAQKFIFN